ncbi:MAG: DNA-directed RNA polymerase, subunit E'' [Candidatus Diapherotrites archaeon]|uniref:Transcription elongation factor Spt4 n=1 Tax=Candidatus Iainarchaeum sp. TaxID=3101447 RepID=A0A8T4LGV0_9ARCH|nr:DNA-directed RNA polymerase, subunit E'' [Candidatus Diapherotrites archaeon]
MATEKACRQCRRIVEEATTCPDCGGAQFTTFWRGFITIADPEKSEIAKKMGITQKGKHALRLSQ